MFGYIIPVKCKLTDQEYGQFRAAYCGLCHSLKCHYGLAARFVLNFDFTFLAILLTHAAGEISYSKRRCMAHPFRKRSCCEGGEPFRQAAGYSLILTRWKLRDGIADSSFAEGLLYRLAALFLRRACRKAARDFPAFDVHCRAKLEQLHTLEKVDSGDLDRVADAFSAILPAATAYVTDEIERRVFMDLLYHTGRWIYLIDAYDDLEQDKRSGNYNPLAVRFEVQDGKLADADKVWLETTLAHSANRIISAYNLLPDSAWSAILENIIYLGFPAVTEGVFTGRFRRHWGRWKRKDDI